MNEIKDSDKENKDIDEENGEENSGFHAPWTLLIIIGIIIILMIACIIVINCIK